MVTMHPLTEWLTHPSPDAGVYLADSADGWQVQSYPELAAAARRVAAALAAEGVRPGDTVCVLLRPGPSCREVPCRRHSSPLTSTSATWRPLSGRRPPG